MSLREASSAAPKYFEVKGVACTSDRSGQDDFLMKPDYGAGVTLGTSVK
jgi:hypothetical protein